MIRLKITKTWKSYSPRASWESYDMESKFFDTVQEAKTWAKENLPSGKRSPMYCDTKSRGTIKCGYIIGFRVDDFDGRGKRVKHLEQWWVSFETVIRHPTEGKPGEVESLAL